MRTDGIQKIIFHKKVCDNMRGYATFFTILLLLLFYLPAIGSASINTYVVPAISDTKIIPASSVSSSYIGSEISAQVCPDEYKALSFVIKSDTSLNNLNISPSDLHCSNRTIPSSAIDLKWVKCWYKGGYGTTSNFQMGRYITPELLLNNDPLINVNGDNWTDPYLSNNNGTNSLELTDGSYVDISNGSITQSGMVIVPILKRPIQDSNTLRPINLSANYNKQVWITIHVPNGTSAGTYTGTIKLTNNVSVLKIMNISIQVLPFTLPYYETSVYYHGFIDNNGSISSENKTLEQFKAEMRNCLAHGITNPTVYYKFNDTQLCQEMAIRQSVGINNTNLYIISIDAYQIPYFKKLLAQYGVQNIYVYGWDEANMNTTEGRAYIQNIRNNGGYCFVAQSTTQAKSVSDILDLVIAANDLSPSLAANYHTNNHKIFSYGNPQTVPEYPRTFRLNYGLLLWQNCYDGTMAYAYQHSMGDIWNDFDGVTYRDHVFSYPTQNGVIDTIKFEGFREGINDFRYVKALENAIASDPSSLTSIEANDYLTQLNSTDLTNANLDAVRAKIVDYILAIQNNQHYLNVYSGSGSGIYINGTKIKISASTPPVGMSFEKWTGDIQYLSDSSSETATITMPSHEVSLTAQYNNSWYNYSWGKRLKITIPHANVSHTDSNNMNFYLSNFPLLISISVPRSDINKDHSDLLFVSSDNKILNFEIISCDTNGNILAKVQVPQLKDELAQSDTTIYFYYDNPTVTVPYENRTNTWDDNFKAVWHLNEKIKGSFSDSSINNNINTNSVKLPYAVNGIFGKAQYFNGSTFINFGHNSSLNLTSGMTLHAWILPTSDYVGYATKPIKKYSTLTDANYVLYWFGTTSGNNRNMQLYATAGGNWKPVGSSNIPNIYAQNLNSWYDVDITYDSRMGGMAYLNGVQTGWSAPCGNLATNDIDMIIGGSNYVGAIEEVELSNISRSADWIKTQWKNEFSPNTFYNVGSTESVPLIYQLKVMSGTGSGSYLPDSNVTINANSMQSGIIFDKWIGDTQYLSNVSSASQTVSVTKNITLTATYIIPWADLNYSNRKILLVNHTKVSKTDQMNYQMLVSIKDCSLKSIFYGGKLANEKGHDIIFTLPNKTKLNYELEYYNNATGNLIVWVYLPLLSVSNDTYVVMYYGNSNVTISQENKSSVWGSNYVGVWHLDEEGTKGVGDYKDTSGNNNNNTNSANQPTVITGQIGKAQSFNTSTNINFGHSSTLNLSDRLTIHTWITPTADYLGYAVRPFKKYTSTSDSNLIMYYFGKTSGQNRLLQFYANAGSIWQLIGGGYTLTNNQSYCVDLTYDSYTGGQLYINGVPSGALTGNGQLAVNSADFIIGSSSFYIDEVRLSNTKISADRIKTQYNNEFSPSTFYTVTLTENNIRR